MEMTEPDTSIGEPRSMTDVPQPGAENGARPDERLC